MNKAMAQVEELQNRALDAEHTLEEVKMELLQVYKLYFSRRRFSRLFEYMFQLPWLYKILFSGQLQHFY